MYLRIFILAGLIHQKHFKNMFYMLKASKQNLSSYFFTVCYLYSIQNRTHGKLFRGGLSEKKIQIDMMMHIKMQLKFLLFTAVLCNTFTLPIKGPILLRWVQSKPDSFWAKEIPTTFYILVSKCLLAKQISVMYREANIPQPDFLSSQSKWPIFTPVSW